MPNALTFISRSRQKILQVFLGMNIKSLKFEYLIYWGYLKNLNHGVRVGTKQASYYFFEIKDVNTVFLFS